MIKEVKLAEIETSNKVHAIRPKWPKRYKTLKILFIPENEQMPKIAKMGKITENLQESNIARRHPIGRINLSSQS